MASASRLYWSGLICVALSAVLFWGCGGDGGGSGGSTAGRSDPSNAVPVVASVQVGVPVNSGDGEGAVDGPVSPGDMGTVEVVPEGGAPYSRMQVWLQVNVSGAEIDHYDWEIRDWGSSPPNGILTNYDSVVDLDGSNAVCVVRTMSNHVRYDSATIAQLAALDSTFTQTVEATAWTAEGLFASANFALNVSAPAQAIWPGLDLNTNGVSDVWEAAYSLPPGFDLEEDADLDGQNNYQEGVAGTDPNDPGSVLSLATADTFSNAHLVRWNSIAGKRYLAEATTSPSGDEWVAVGGIVRGTGDEVLAAFPQSDPPFLDFRPSLLVDNPAFLEAMPFLPDVDTDFDGMADVDEWAAGTDPFDGDSWLAVTGSSIGPAVVLSWPSVAGKHYQVESCSNPASCVWTPEGGLLQGDGSELTTAVEVTGGQQLFRVSVVDGDEDLDGVTDWEEALLGFDTQPLNYRIEHPTDTNTVVALLNSGNVIQVEIVSAVANATTGTPGGWLITRTGSVNQVTVQYSVAGDAIPGVDYEQLPGVITLPPGIHSIEIPVVPLDGAGLTPSKSVQLTLVSGPGYAVETNSASEIHVLREVALSVTDFGAVGDGVTDDTLAIQAAINALRKSATHNTLHFPSGTYRLNRPTFDSRIPISQRYLLRLGNSNLAGRDLVIRGEPGAVLYSTVSWARTHILAVHASFRSLAFRGLIWKKEGNPLPTTTGEPNGADGVCLIRYDARKVEAVEFLDCTFENCHGAVFTYDYGTDVWGRLGRLVFRRCEFRNPYGSNTIDASQAYGGGQLVYLNPWVGLALYADNDFDGGADGPVDPVRNPDGIRKDGSHFGSPRQLIFTNNVVRRMQVEAVVQSDDPLMGYTQTAFIVPPADGSSTATVLVRDTPSTFEPGQILNFRVRTSGTSLATNVFLTVESYDPPTRQVTVRNDGLASQFAGIEVPVATSIYLQSYSPTTVLIRDNIIDAGPGLTGTDGISSSAKGTISQNLIMGYRKGVDLAENVRSPLFPPSQGAFTHSNVILTPVSGAFTRGVDSWAPEDFIAHNLIVARTTLAFVGIVVRASDSWIEGNRVLPEVVNHTSYYDARRSVGIGMGNSSLNATAVANWTSGFDVGVGPAQPSQIIPHRVISHFSTNDVLAIDPRGLSPDSLP